MCASLRTFYRIYWQVVIVIIMSSSSSSCNNVFVFISINNVQLWLLMEMKKNDDDDDDAYNMVVRCVNAISKRDQHRTLGNSDYTEQCNRA